MSLGDRQNPHSQLSWLVARSSLWDCGQGLPFYQDSLPCSSCPTILSSLLVGVMGAGAFSTLPCPLLGWAEQEPHNPCALAQVSGHVLASWAFPPEKWVPNDKTVGKLRLP
jgi:hypothetical protein